MSANAANQDNGIKKRMWIQKCKRQDCQHSFPQASRFLPLTLFIERFSGECSLKGMEPIDQEKHRATPGCQRRQERKRCEDDTQAAYPQRNQTDIAKATHTGNYKDVLTF